MKMQLVVSKELVLESSCAEMMLVSEEPMQTATVSRVVAVVDAARSLLVDGFEVA